MTGYRKFLFVCKSAFLFKTLMAAALKACEHCLLQKQALENNRSIVSFKFLNAYTMKNLTLRFPSLESLEAFARQLHAGYSMNKHTLTITAKLLDSQLVFAARLFGAQRVDAIAHFQSITP